MKRGWVIEFRGKLNRSWKLFKSYVGWEDYLAVMLIILGVLGFFEGPIPYVPHLTDIFLGVRSELIGIGITVLIIDNVNEMYRKRAEKERLILQMGSSEHIIASEAARQLRVLKYITDGSLRKAQLQNANLYLVDLNKSDLRQANLSGGILRKSNLEEADLSNADLNYIDLTDAILINSCLQNVKMDNAILRGAGLRNSNLSFASLIKTDLSFADLSNAILEQTILNLANLRGVDLRNANLSGSSVTNAQLTQVRSINGATMPDGRIYNPSIHTEIAKFRKDAGMDNSDYPN